MQELPRLIGPLAILTFIGLTKYLTGKGPVQDLGIAFSRLPRISGLLLLVMAGSAWMLSQTPRIPQVIVWQTEVLAPMLAMLSGVIGLILVLFGQSSQKLINPRPQEVASTPLQSMTMWGVILLSVAFGLVHGLLRR